MLVLLLGLALTAVVIISAIDVVRRLDSAFALADSGATLSEEAYLSAERNGLYVLGFLGGAATTLMAGASLVLLRLVTTNSGQNREVRSSELTP